MPGIKLTALHHLFDARAVAVVGASQDVSTIPGKPLIRLRQHGYAGRVTAVNPRYEALGDVDCVPSVHDLPDGTEVALIMLRADRIAQAIVDCGQKGIATAVVVSSGFEVDDVPGRKLNTDLRRAIEESGVRVVGPNCEGVWNIPNRMLLTFGSAADRETLHEGPVSVISQSGSLGAAVMRELQDREVGCRFFVSSGNEIDVTMMDLCEFMIDEGGSAVIAMFIEGLRDGWRLRQIAAKARVADVDLIVLRSGQSKEGRLATQSHTGRVASASAVYRDVLRDAGILEVVTLGEFVDATQLAAQRSRGLRRPVRRGPESGVGIVAVSGGSRALLVDSASRRGVPLAVFGHNTEKGLMGLLPDFAYARNPVDVTGAVVSSPQFFEDVLKVVAGDDRVEALIVQYANGGHHQIVQHAGLLRSITETFAKPVVVGLLAGHAVTGSELGVESIVVTRDPEESVRTMEWLYRLGDARVPTTFSDRPSLARAVVPVTWSERVHLIDAAGIESPPWRLVGSVAELDAALSQLRAPWVIKASPEYAEHKTEMNLVHLRLSTRHEAVDAMHMIQRTIGDGVHVLIQEMVIGGQEMLVAARSDPDMGPVLALGFGGVLTEWVNDITFLCLPTTAADVEAALRRLRSWPLLEGFRGAAPLDIEALVTASVGFGALFVQNYQGAELEINPLVVLERGRGVRALDVLAMPGT